MERIDRYLSVWNPFSDFALDRKSGIRILNLNPDFPSERTLSVNAKLNDSLFIEIKYFQNIKILEIS